MYNTELYTFTIKPRKEHQAEHKYSRDIDHEERHGRMHALIAEHTSKSETVAYEYSTFVSHDQSVIEIHYAMLQVKFHKAVIEQ